ncbi:MAG TPA: hypothetical protein VHV82_03310 [Sporichthyaceae bacterium]|nr:hypothetical protein [Sporichthyaceae bacterium]
MTVRGSRRLAALDGNHPDPGRRKAAARSYGQRLAPPGVGAVEHRAPRRREENTDVPGGGRRRRPQGSHISDVAGHTAAGGSA